MEKQSFGQIHDSAMFLRASVGDANDNEGNNYEMSTGVATGSPIVTNKTTGLTFTLSWEDIITLAKQAGIDKKESTNESKT